MRSLSSLLCLCAAASLAGCGTSAPSSALPPMAAVYPPGTIEGRISSLETRVDGLQSQINQMNEKWLVAQSKLTDAAMALRALDPASAAPLSPMHQAGTPQTGLYAPEKTAGAQSIAPIVPAIKPVIHEPAKSKLLPIQTTPYVPAAKPIISKPIKDVSTVDKLDSASDHQAGPVKTKSVTSTPATFEPMEKDVEETTPTTAPHPVLESVSRSPKKPIEKISSPVSSNMTGITSIRVGDYPDKTRLVIDVGAPITFTHDIDNAERILVITTSAKSLSAPMQGAFTTSPLVSAYSAEKTADGSVRLVLQLRAAVKVVKAQALGPSEGKGHRIMFDLIPGS
jgi:predicted small lipoprotein YifL